MREKVIKYLNASSWEDLTDVRSGDIIPCVIDGQMIEAAVHASPKDITVSLYGIKPKLQASSHIMLMAPKIYTVEPWDGSNLNDYGVLRAKELLAGLYHDYKIITGNLEQIRILLPKFTSAKERCSQSISQLTKRKASLKKSFKAGGLTQHEYMGELENIKSSIQEEEMLLSKTFKEIFSPILSECEHCNNLMEAVETLFQAE
jgi:ribosome recycling factor